MSLTVVCWKWSGWRSVYAAEHVNVLELMLKEHLHTDHRLVCVTDDPEGVNCETIPIWDYPQVNTGAGRPNCFRRLRMFAPEAVELFGPRVLSIDLDCLIFDDITPLITDDDLKLPAGEASPYNGSMILHTAGSRPELWDEFDPNTFHQIIAGTQRKDGKPFYGSDQAWISYRAPNGATWGPEDGVYFFRQLEAMAPEVPKNLRIMFFPGAHKPWDYSMKRQLPIVRTVYRKYAEALHK